MNINYKSLCLNLKKYFKERYCVLLLLMLLSGFNFLDQFKVGSIPLFQLLLVGIIFFALVKTKKLFLPKQAAIRAYLYYSLFSLIPLIIGIDFGGRHTILVYAYSILPFVLFLLTYKNIDHSYLDKLLKTMNISMLLITILGWMLRLRIIGYNIFFHNVTKSQFALGYWGIRYLTSTRNSDYLYPLVGLGISIYVYLKHKYNIYILLIIFYLLTLIDSLSRAAFLIDFLAIIILMVYSSIKSKIKLLSILMILIIYNFDSIMQMFEDKYSIIIASIFHLRSISSRFSNTARLGIIRHVLKSSALNPLGYGIGNFSSIYHIFNISGRVSYSAENAFLTILVERGWIPFLFFIVSLYFMLRKAVSAKITLNKILLPFLLIYFSFNYGLNNVFGCFLFYILFLDYYLSFEKERKAHEY